MSPPDRWIAMNITYAIILHEMSNYLWRNPDISEIETNDWGSAPL